jgi:hypothetical protein
MGQRFYQLSLIVAIFLFFSSSLGLVFNCVEIERIMQDITI